MKPKGAAKSGPGAAAGLPQSLSVSEFCERSGFSQPWLYRLAKRGHFPESQGGVYPFRESVQGLLEYLRGTKTRLSQLRERKLRAEIAIQAVKLKGLHGRYISRAKAGRDLESCDRTQRRILEPILTKQWPAQATGKTQIELIELGQATTDRICGEFRNPKPHQYEGK